MNLISLFNSMRDIPYRIPLKWGEQDNCCSGKHIRLYNALIERGYEVRYRVCAFSWSNLNLPEEIEKIPHDRECTHTYLEVFLNNKWITLDATWDEGLKNILSVNEWDGKSDTTIAVKPIKIFSPEESAEIIASENKDVIEEDLKRNGNFYKAFNDWLGKIRR